MIVTNIINISISLLDSLRYYYIVIVHNYYYRVVCLILLTYLKCIVKTKNRKMRMQLLQGLYAYTNAPNVVIKKTFKIH